MTGLFPAEQAHRELRDYQVEAIDRLRESLRAGHKRPVLQAPVGAGKTLTAAALITMARQKNRRVVFTVPALSLIDQTIEAFAQDGITDIGVIQGSHGMTDWSQPTQIASVQTLARRQLPDCDLVIVDEAHRQYAVLQKWIEACPDLPFIGLSATPWSKGLGKYFDDLVVLTTTQKLIDEGYLSDFRVFAPSHPDLKGVRVQRGDYVEGDLSGAMNKAPLVADVVQTWLERGENRQTLCFAVDRAHAKHLQQRFQESGVSCGYQDMNTDALERRQLKRDFHSGAIKVVVSIDSMIMGVDWDVRCISMCRPTKSDMLFVQAIGRGLRTAPGKDHLILLDHSDNSLRLGFVTDIDVAHTSLDEGKQNSAEPKKPPLPKECPKCHYLRPPRVSKCPACGFEPVMQPKPVETVDGQLEELAGGMARKQGGTKKVTGTDILFGQQRMPLASFYAQLVGYGMARGYKEGWAAAKYKDAAGRWPSRSWDRTRTEPVTMEVRNWIIAQHIRYSKRKAA